MNVSSAAPSWHSWFSPTHQVTSRKIPLAVDEPQDISITVGELPNHPEPQNGVLVSSPVLLNVLATVCRRKQYHSRILSETVLICCMSYLDRFLRAEKGLEALFNIKQYHLAAMTCAVHCHIKLAARATGNGNV
jgi:hypothetical protein